MNASSPTRILFVLTSSVRGGIEEVVLSLLSRLDRDEFQPALAAPAVLLDAISKEPPLQGVPTFSAAASSWLDWREVGALARAIRSFRPDIVNPHLFRATLVAAPLAKWLGVPSVVETYHGREAWRHGPIRGSFLVDRMVSRYVDRIVAVSEAAKDFLVLRKRIWSEKVVVVPNGCDLSIFQPGCGGGAIRDELSLESGTIVLGIVGRLEEQKGHRYGLQAFARVTKEYPHSRLLVIGEGSLRGALEEEAREMGLGARVIFMGFRSDVPRLLDAMDIVMLPSLHEGMPLVAIEAAAMAKPLVATAVDGTREVVVDGDTGRLVPPCSSEALALATLELLSNKAVATQMGSNARRLALAAFGLERSTKKVADVYRRSLMACKPAKGQEGAAGWNSRHSAADGLGTRLSVASEADFAIVIPTKNRARVLLRLLEALLTQPLSPREVLIVDQSESREGEAAARSLFAASPTAPRLTYVRDPSIVGLTQARNKGLQMTTADIVVYCDDDGVPHPQAITLLLQALLEHSELVATGAIITSYHAPSIAARAFSRVFCLGPLWDERQPVYWNWRSWSVGQLVPTTKLNGGLMAIRRAGLLGVGGFDDAYRGSSVGEDIEISERLAARADRADALALVGGAWLAHDSLGDWKSSEHVLARQLVASHYRLRKNGPKGLVGTLLFLWMSCGLVLAALVSAARRSSVAPLRSLASGWRCLRNGYAGCSFLRPQSNVEERAVRPPASRAEPDGV